MGVITGFEFYFAFYGLLLGLSVAEVASGFLNAIGARRSIAVGWHTPLLAIFIFLDISTFWMFAWGIREGLSVSWGTMFGGLFVALSYYFAAGLVFPRDVSEWTSLDEHYSAHKRLVVSGILVANAIVFAQAIAIQPPSFGLTFWFSHSTYWPPLVALLFSRSSKADLVLLGIAIGGYLALPFLPTSWDALAG